MHTLNTPRVLTVICLVAIFSISGIAFSAERFTGDFEELDASRVLAYDSAVISVTRDALANFVRDENWNPEILDCMETWISSELAPDYKYLVSNTLFDIDQEIRGQWAIEGSMRIEMGFLNRWVKKQLSDPDCGPRIQQRRTIYLEPIFLADPDDQKIANLSLKQIQQFFTSNGYEFVDESRRQTAQYRMNIDGIQSDARGSVKTLSISGYYVDNRVDNQPYLSINSTVDARLKTTTTELNKQLAERQSRSVLAQVREWEASHIVENRKIEIIFVSKKSTGDLVDALLDSVMTRFALPKEFSEQADAIQTTALNDGLIEISIIIPARYGATLNRSRMRELQEVAREILSYKVAASNFSNNATKLTIFDSSSIKAEWEKQVWAYLDTGKLIFPENHNALAVTRQQLIKNSNNDKALYFIDEIVGRLIQRAIYKIGQGALNSANANLTQAQSIGATRPNKPWAAAREQLDAAIARQRKQRPTNGTIIVADSNGASASDKPLVLFPEIESWASRAIGIQENRGILGVAADIQGIKRIELNGQSIAFENSSEQQSEFLSVPGAQTQVFYLPPDLTAGKNQLTVVVTDGNNKKTEKVLSANNGSYIVSNPPFGSPNNNKEDNSKTIKEGEEALKGRYHALIIANQEYLEVPDLATPAHDARQLSKVLIEQYNFNREHVTTLVNGTREEMVLAIDRLQDEVGPNDSVLIYYAGHGHQDKGHGGTGYWIPVDGKNVNKKGHRTSWVPNGYVADYVEKIKARHVLLISDSCYAGTFAQRGNESDFYMATNEYIKTKAGQNSRRAITSGDIEPVSDGGGNGHSIFAHHLLAALRDQEAPYLTAERLYKKLYGPVSHGAAQTPQYFVMSDNDEGGDFIFIKR